MDSSSIAFWAILAGMLIVFVLTVVIVYFTCFTRNQSNCMCAEGDDLLETIHHEEVHRVTSETRTSLGGTEEPTVVHRSEQIHRVTTKQRSRGNILTAHTSQPVTTKIRVSPKGEQAHSHTSSSKNNDTAFSASNFGDTLTSPRPGQLQLTSIGISS